MSSRGLCCATLLLLADLVLFPGTARADLVLSQLVVDLQQGKQSKSDVEILNNGPDRAYVEIDPREILGAGTPAEATRESPDPEQLGLLVSPDRMILEPGQRRIIRIASIAPAAERERVYRVTVKPVVGQLQSGGAALKILVGYDMLILVRPQHLAPQVAATRSGNRLTLRNSGNVSVELVDGKACDSTGKACDQLDGGRLYAGAQREMRVQPGSKVSFTMKVRDVINPISF